MPTPALVAHVTTCPSAPDELDLAEARWADDGGSIAEPSALSQAREAEWARVSTELAERFTEPSGREDVIVTAVTRTRAGAPGMFDPTYAQMEIERRLFHADPEDLHPINEGDEEGYPVAWGVFTHEAGHAAHSRWDVSIPSGSDPADRQAANLLEESRIEHKVALRRPEDRKWLRASASALILPEIDANAPADRHQVAHAAGLILARCDAGILDLDEVTGVQALAEKVLGHDTLTELQRIWQEAHHTGDEDGVTMISLGRAWNEAIGTAHGHEATAEELAAAIASTIGAVRRNDKIAADLAAAIEAAAASRQAAKRSEAEAARRAQQTAKEVFASHGRRRNQWNPVIGTRPPTAAERAAAGKLARALRAAAYRERIETVTTAAAPPGRLSMRGALARDAQRAAGALPTAEPWIATRRRHSPTPPLRVGIAVDVSGSMGEATGPIASASWILSKAAASTDPESKTATVAFDRNLAAITHPGRVPDHVTEFAAVYGGHDLAGAIDALDGGLELTRPGAGRLLIVASDGEYFFREAPEAAARINRLIHHGCPVLWLAFAPDPKPLPGTTLVQLNDPASAIDEIAKAATHAIATTR